MFVKLIQIGDIFLSTHSIKVLSITFSCSTNKRSTAAIFKGWGVKAVPRKDKITELLCQNKEAAKLKKPVSTLYMLSSIEENSKFQDTSRKLEF
jgi:hypothetical protein